MIRGFEDFTVDLDEKDKEVAEALADYFKMAVGRDKAITSISITKLFSSAGTKLEGSMIRKMVQYIRVNNLCPNLCASQKGYYVAQTKQEKEQYIESMRERIRSMQFTLSCIVHYDNAEKMDELNKTNNEKL